MRAQRARLRKLGQAVLVITEPIAKHLLRMLSNRRRGHWIDDRRARISDRQPYIRHPSNFRMRDPGHDLTLSRFRRANGLADGAYLPARHARRAHLRLPI